MPNESNRPDVAVFIDFENVYVSVRDKLDANPNFESIMDRCEDFGRVVIARAYADWYRYPRVTSALYANGIEPMYVPTYYYDREMGRTGRAIKNSVDMNLCIDAMKTLFTHPNIAKFVLATGDRDFIPLVNSIRQQGKEVIIIGVGGAASAHLAQSADEFIFYESLVGKKPSELQQDQPRAKMPEKGREQPEAEDLPDRGREREGAREKEATPDVYDTLVQAIHLARERGYVCSFGSLKLLMKELMGGDFKEGRYKDASGKPFAKFKDFVLEAERRGKVQVFTSGTINEVFLPGEDPYKLSQFAQELKEEPAPELLEAPPLDVRPEQRVATASNGRRRRRRPRGGQRPGLAHPEEAAQLEAAPDIDEEEAAALEYTLPDEATLAPDLIDEEQAEAVFDELLDRIEAEDVESQALAALDPLEVMAAPLPDDAIASPEEEAPAEPGLPAFTEQEWQVLREVVARHERPLSFAHIHAALREARKNAGIERTNEELRTLIKQAINSGMLERRGKGNRATYRLAPPPAAVAEEAADQATVIAPPVDQPEHPEPAERIAEPAEEPPAFYTPEAAAQAELATAPEAEPIEVITAAEPAVEAPAPAPAKRTRARRKPAVEPGPEQSAAATAAKPKRTRARKASSEESGAPAATPSKRTRRKRTDDTA